MSRAADARQRAEWGRSLSLMWFLKASFDVGPPNPESYVPTRYLPPPAAVAVPASPEARERRVNRSWQALDAFAAQISRG